MRQIIRYFAVVTAVVIGITATAQAGVLKVSNFEDLQAAIDAAQDGDTIVVDVDTPGALVDKKITLRGTPGRGTGGLITGTAIRGVSTGLLLSSDASGSELANLKISASVGIASDFLFYGVMPASDVTVRGCMIESDAFGLYLLNHLQLGSGGWIIEHNTIELHGATPRFGASFGIALTAYWDDTRVAHNKISGTKPGGDPLGAGGVIVIASANVEIVHNEISVRVEDDAHWAEAVFLSGAPIPDPGSPYVPISNTTVYMNDFRGCDTTRGPYGVTYRGPLDGGSDLTGLGAFDHIDTADGVPGTFTIGGNLSSGVSNRGGISAPGVPQSSGSTGP